MIETLQAGDLVEFDVVVGTATVKGCGRVTAVIKAGPMIKPNNPLPNGAKLEKIEKVIRG